MPARRRSRRRSRRRAGRPTGQLGRSFIRRRSTRWLVAAIITLTVGIVLGIIAGSGDDSATEAGATPTLAVALPAIVPDATLLQRAEVVNVIDGDTIDVRIDGRTERVRYYGIDTPERGDRCFGAATDRNEALAGETVLLLADARERDSFDRLLRYVFADAGESIDARLIAEGLAVAWRADGAYRDALVSLEEEARAADAGCLWGS